MVIDISDAIFFTFSCGKVSYLSFSILRLKYNDIFVYFLLLFNKQLTTCGNISDGKIRTRDQEKIADGDFNAF